MARLLLRFDDAATVAAWRAIDDAVMAGPFALALHALRVLDATG